MGGLCGNGSRVRVVTMGHGHDGETGTTRPSTSPRPPPVAARDMMMVEIGV
jgi:hypothetical protein